VIESSIIPTVGVGEATVPGIRLALAFPNPAKPTPPANPPRTNFLEYSRSPKLVIRPHPHRPVPNRSTETRQGTHMIEIHLLRYATAAADQFNMKPSRLSKRIHYLELRLGLPIFRRSTRGVVPTKPGEERQGNGGVQMHPPRWSCARSI